MSGFTESIAIDLDLQLRGYEGVRSDLVGLDRLIKSFGGRKKFDMGFREAKTQVVAYRGELEKLEMRQRKLQQYMKGAGKGDWLGTKALEGNAKAIEETKRKLKDAQQAVREFGLASQYAGKTFKQTFNSISAQVAHFGGALQSMGNALTRFSTPVRSLMRGTVFAAGYKALNMVTSGFGGMFERYDTMQNYARSMKALGLEADKTFKVFSNQKEAMTAIDNLNEAVLGLPTGLDEIVAMQKVYAGATGEMVKSTKTAIAANNTFLASSMGSREQRFMQKYLVALSSGAELTTTQWQSMARIAPLAMRAVSEELGYASDEYAQFTKEVQSGTIAGEDFLKAFIKVGTEGRVSEAANVMKTTWEGLGANIQNATRRMGEGMLKALDDVFKAYNGRNLIQNLLGVDAKGRKVGTSIKDIIDGISKSAQDWVRANPERIMDFINKFRSIDWSGFAKGFVDGFGELFRMFEKFADYASGKSLENLGRWMVRFSWLGRGLVVIGGIVKGLRHPIALISTVLSRLLGGMGGDSIFGKISKMLGKNDEIKDVGKVSLLAKNALKSLLDVAVAAGSVAIGFGAGVVAFKGFKTMLNDLKGITQIMTEIDWGTANTAISAMGVFLAGFLGASKAVGSVVAGGGIAAIKPFAIGTAVVGAFTTFVSGVAALDMWMLRKGADNLKKLTESLVGAKENLQKLQGITIDKAPIRSTLDALSEVYELFKPQYQGNGIGNMSVLQSGNISKIMNYMVKTIGSLKTLEGSLKEASEFTGFDEATVGKVKDIFKGLGDIYDEIKKSFSGTNGTSVSGAEAVSKIVDSTKKTFDTLLGKEGIISQFRKFSKEMPTIIGGSDKRGADIVDSVKQSLGNLFGALGEMYKSVAKDYGWIITADSTKTFNEIIGNTQDTFSKLIGEGGVISQISNLSKALPGIVAGSETAGRGKSPLDAVKDRLTNMFDSIGELYKSIAEDYGWMVTGESTKNVDAIIDNISTTFGRLIGEEGMIAQITKLSQDLSNIVSGSETAGRGKTLMDNVKEQLTNLFKGLEEIQTAFNATTLNDDGGAGAETFSTAMNSLAQGIEKMKGAVAKLQEMGGVNFDGEGGIYSVITKIRSVISRLTTAFGTEGIDALKAQIEAFKTAIQTALDGLADLGEEIEIDASVKLAEGFGTSVDAVISEIDTAASNIKSSWGKIPTSLSKTITISISYKKNIDPFPRVNIPPGYSSTGGYIAGPGRVTYRAKGGSIFRPRGTDIVPAMLTPGEYVQNKRAVDFFGIDFMRKVNHLDVQGALQSLMTKAGGMASASTTINNYNNQKVVINNNGTPSAGYTFKRASRFVGAF